jgi:hypothetical protein
MPTPCYEPSAPAASVPLEPTRTDGAGSAEPAAFGTDPMRMVDVGTSLYKIIHAVFSFVLFFLLFELSFVNDYVHFAMRKFKWAFPTPPSLFPKINCLANFIPTIQYFGETPSDDLPPYSIARAPYYSTLFL